MEYSFNSWLQRRHKKHGLALEADKIIPLVAQAGAAGMDRRQLGNAIKLEREVLDELLDGLVELGWLAVASEDGIKVFRTRSQLSGVLNQ